MKTVCYYHNDLDGITSGASVLIAYPDAKMIPINYGDTWYAAEVADNRVFVVDFSFPEMLKLQAACAELIWCDHHKTVYDTQKKAWNNPKIGGYRSLDYAGCMLTYAFLNDIKLEDLENPDIRNALPAVVRYISTYDLWKHTPGDEVDAFCATAFVKLTAPDSEDFCCFFEGSDGRELDYIEMYAETGYVLIESAMNRVKHLANREEPVDIKTPIGKIKLLFVNATSDVSRLGDYINSVLGCDIAAIYEIIGENCKVSLRSKTCNIDQIAVIFGGGGHPHAAGFVTDDAPSKCCDNLSAVIYKSYVMLDKRK